VLPWESKKLHLHVGDDGDV